MHLGLDLQGRRHKLPRTRRVRRSRAQDRRGCAHSMPYTGAHTIRRGRRELVSMLHRCVHTDIQTLPRRVFVVALTNCIRRYSAKSSLGWHQDIVSKSDPRLPVVSISLVSS